jgi:hypothetical protein
MSWLIAVGLHAVFFGFLTAWLAERKHYNARTWFILGVLLGLVAAFLLYLQPERANDDAAPTPAR